jgi:hypothetical protein
MVSQLNIDALVCECAKYDMVQELWKYTQINTRCGMMQNSNLLIHRRLLWESNLSPLQGQILCGGPLHQMNVFESGARLLHVPKAKCDLMHTVQSRNVLLA